MFAAGSGGRSLLSRSPSFRPDTLGHSALHLIGNLCFAIFVLAVLVFTILAATYQPDDPLLHPSSSRLTSFLSSSSNATFRSDLDSAARTGEDFLQPNSTSDPSSEPAVPTVADVAEHDSSSSGAATTRSADECSGAIDCLDPEVYNLIMRVAIEHFHDLHFYRFGKPVPVPDSDSTCDLAWRFRPKDAKRASFYKDYRRFVLSRSDNCTISVSQIGDYHSGVLARRKRKKQGPSPSADSAASQIPTNEAPKEEKLSVPEVGEAVNDTLPDEEGQDFRFYFDFEHLRESASVLDQQQFWTDWSQWQKKDGLGLYLVEDFRVTPMKLTDVKDTLIMRKFGNVEPDNYWYRVCEGETESVIQRPWHLLWKSPRLMDIVSAIASRMNWDFDSVHIVRGEKAKNTQLWPNLAADTSPDALLSTLGEKIDNGRHLYIATNEPDTAFFDPLKDKYTIHFLDDFKDLWDPNSEWYMETMKLNNGVAVEFDGYMRVEVDTEVFLRGKKQIETFNDLTKDCKDEAQATSFTFSNQCNYTVWAGTLSGAGTPELSQTGFKLLPGYSTTLSAPPGWSGRFWGRTFCSTDSTGKFSCATADCATGTIPCSGSGGIPPATLAEITLGINGEQDYYDISLVDGFNLPISLFPVDGHGNCKPASCGRDVNRVCPSGMRVTGESDGAVIACKSACDAFGDAKYCCTGVYASPSSCKPTYYSRLFKAACPAAYSYAFDDPSSTFTCTAATAYFLTFCP
ncbi:hypothetical protein J5N97_023121 [Dioscorea zingiberensis]|uniref:O-fucosyltransferase family protein n=1 Tax=Dioscorea zingiberensis TaxID=325984 RepID=A0A9D5CC17_9LILI|nr:hypothetical protein J5N97_023121 [Dioscorea zingiberensis]